MKKTPLQVALCIGLIALGRVAMGATCVADGGTVTVSGTVHTRTVKPDPAEGLRGFTYDRLALDSPICLKAGDFDGVPNGKSAAISSSDYAISKKLKNGAHVTVTGTISPKETSNDPPEPFKIDVTGMQ
jgi:hypothetical protein